MRDPALSDLFVRDLDRIPLPPREQWIRRPSVVKPRLALPWPPPAFASAAIVAALVVAAVVGLQPAAQQALDRGRRGSDRSDPDALPALRLALRQVVDFELSRPTLTSLLDGATRRIEILLRDRAISAALRRPALSGSFDDDVTRYVDALRDLSARSGLPLTELQDAALQGVAAFDGECAAYYFPNAEVQAGERARQFAGTIGVTVRQSPRTFAFEIGVVRAGSPAERAGLRPGDVIRSIDGRTAASAGELAALLRGNPGSLARVRGERAGAPFDLQIERAALAVPALGYRLIDGTIGHLDLRATVEPTEVRTAIDALEADARAWIVDLRYHAWPDGAGLEQLLIGRFAGTGQYGIAADRTGSETPLGTGFAGGSPVLPRQPVVALVSPYTDWSGLVIASLLQERGAVLIGEPAARCANRYRVVSLESGDLYIRDKYVMSAVTRRDLGTGLVPDVAVAHGTGPGDAILDAALARIRAQLR